MARNGMYDLDGVANIDADDSMASVGGGIYPQGKGNVDMDKIESVRTSSGMTYGVEESYPTGPRVELDATTGLPMGKGAEMSYDGGNGHVEKWPKGWE